jgi:hypothetical protein
MKQPAPAAGDERGHATPHEKAGVSAGQFNDVTIGKMAIGESCHNRRMKVKRRTYWPPDCNPKL